MIRNAPEGTSQFRVHPCLSVVSVPLPFVSIRGCREGRRRESIGRKKGFNGILLLPERGAGADK